MRLLKRLWLRLTCRPRPAIIVVVAHTLDGKQVEGRIYAESALVEGIVRRRVRVVVTFAKVLEALTMRKENET